MGWTVWGSNLGGARFSARRDRPWGPLSLLYNGYRVFPGGKVRSERAADHLPPSSAAVMEEYSYTCTHPLGHNRACNGNTLPFYSFLLEAESSPGQYCDRRIVSMKNSSDSIGNRTRGLPALSVYSHPRLTCPSGSGHRTYRSLFRTRLIL